MGVTCKDILNLPYACELKILAGKGSLNKTIRWVHYLEDPSYVNWIKGGELIIISGAIIKDDEKNMIRLLSQLHEKNVSGVIINLSKYIKKISAAIIEEAESLEIVLFEMASEIRIVDISRSICYAIFQENQFKLQHSNIVLEVIYGRKITAKRVKALAEFGISEGEKYCIATVSLEVTDKERADDVELYEINEKKLDNLSIYIEEFFAKESWDVHNIADEEMLLLFIPNKSREDIRNLMKKLFEWLKIKIDNSFIQIAIGREFTSINQMKICVEETKEMAGSIDEEKVCDYYDDLLRVLVKESGDPKWVWNIVNQKLGRLLLDENIELLKTLELYIETGMNIKSAAEKMYVHTNTLYYRINKIQELLEISLNNYNEFFQIQLCLELRKILNSYSRPL